MKNQRARGPADHFAYLPLQPAQGLPPKLVHKSRSPLANETSRRGGDDQHDPRVKTVCSLQSSNHKNRLKHAPRFSCDAVIPLIRRNAASFNVLKSTRINILIATWCLLKTSPACVDTSTRSPCRMQNAAWLKSPTTASPLAQLLVLYPRMPSSVGGALSHRLLESLVSITACMIAGSQMYAFGS